MTVRRTAAGLAVAVVVVLLTAAPALAALTANMRSPRSGATVSGPVELRVAVTRSNPLLDPQVDRVAVRLGVAPGTSAPGSSPAELDCLEGCAPEPGADQQTSVWGGVRFDPASPGAFFGGGAGPVCNGRWYVQPGVNGNFESYPSVEFGVAAAPSPVGSLASSGDADGITVTWSRPPEQDVSGYLVQRRPADQSSWTSLKVLTPGTTSYRDAGLDPGRYDHRVVTLRHDGRTPAGEWVAPCQDSETAAESALGTSSPATTASVPAPPPPSPSPSPSPTGGSAGESSSSPSPTGDGEGGGEPGDGSGGEDTGGTEGGSPAESPGQASGGDDGGQGSRQAGGQVAAPPPPQRSQQRQAQPPLPEQPRQPQPRQRYFGEDDPFSEELDYGDTQPPEVAEPSPTPTETERTTIQRIPGDVRSFVERNLAQERVLEPLAGSLVLFGLALHLARWLREPGGGG